MLSNNKFSFQKYESFFGKIYPDSILMERNQYNEAIVI